MNPELERLLAALAARDNASPAEFDRAQAEVERLLEPILERLSPTTRAEFLRAARPLSRRVESERAPVHLAPDGLRQQQIYVFQGTERSFPILKPTSGQARLVSLRGTWDVFPPRWME